MNQAGQDSEREKQPAPESRPLRVVIAGAGTGGHLFPGIAVAEELMRRQPDTRVLFVTTGKAIEKTVLDRHTFAVATISAAGLKGMGLWQKIKSIFVVPKGFLQSIGLMRQFQPDVVLAMGGYSAGPVLLSAWLMRIPRAIHEQNRLPGMTNRLLGRFATLIFLSFADSQIPGRKKKRVHTGNPVRRQIRECRKTRQQAPAVLDEKPLSVLVLGGSQGAHGLNMAVLDALTYLPEPQKFRFIHQTGAADAEDVGRAYERLAIPATVASFFDNMADHYQAADLAVCRAGATTVAELETIGLPAIFVPFPFAADDHQVANAAGLVSAGAAEMILEKDLTGQLLAERLAYYAENPEKLRIMGNTDAVAGKPDAAERLADGVSGLARRARRKRSVKGYAE